MDDGAFCSMVGAFCSADGAFCSDNGAERTISGAFCSANPVICSDLIVFQSESPHVSKGRIFNLSISTLPYGRFSAFQCKTFPKIFVRLLLIKRKRQSHFSICRFCLKLTTRMEINLRAEYHQFRQYRHQYRPLYPR